MARVLGADPLRPAAPRAAPVPASPSPFARDRPRGRERHTKLNPRLNTKLNLESTFEITTKTYRLCRPECQKRPNTKAKEIYF